MKEELIEALQQSQIAFEQANKAYDEQAQQFWNSLTQEQQLQCFHSVCKRIYKGDIQDQGSYRYVLYNVFGFDPSAYVVGMNCGYLSIHNAIVDGQDRTPKVSVDHPQKRDDHNW